MQDLLHPKFEDMHLFLKVSNCLLVQCEVSLTGHSSPDREGQAIHGDCRWLPDDLGVPSFARLRELRKLPIAQYDGRYDIWTIEAALSEGCGGPDLPEEIML